MRSLPARVSVAERTVQRGGTGARFDRHTRTETAALHARHLVLCATWLSRSTHHLAQIAIDEALPARPADRRARTTATGVGAARVRARATDARARATDARARATDARAGCAVFDLTAAALPLSLLAFVNASERD